jgi:hypothetical protein
VSDRNLIQTDDISPASITGHPVLAGKRYFDVSVMQIVERISTIISEMTET